MVVALSGPAVVDAGAALAAREGLDAVGMRAVAKELGVTPMSLYRHVGDAHALKAAVVDRLLEPVPDVPTEGAWDQRCRSWARAARRVLDQAPGLAHHVLLEWVHQPRVLAALDGLVATLESAGPPGCDPVAGANAILMHVLMRAQAEEAVRGSGTQRDLSTLRLHRRQLPRLWAHRDEYRRARLDEHFEFGLDALLAGIHVMVAGIDADNQASIAFHQRLGFTEVARMPETGGKFDRWLDLVLMQRILP